jgi:hypothetical protein
MKLILTSDHGEGFGERYPALYNEESEYIEKFKLRDSDGGYISVTHGNFPCPSQVRIPLAVYEKTNAGAGVNSKLVGIDNIAPTIETWAGMHDETSMSLLSERKRESLLMDSRPCWFPSERGIAKVAANSEDFWTRIVRQEYIEKDVPQDVKDKLKSLNYI